MIGECQVMSPADKYAAYLKGFEPISFKRNKRGMYYFSESFGAAAAIYTSGKKGYPQHQLSIWSGFSDMFKSGYVLAMYNDELNAFVLVPSQSGIRIKSYANRSSTLQITCKPLIEQIFAKFKLKEIGSNRLRTKRVGDLLFIYDPKTPI